MNLYKIIDNKMEVFSLTSEPITLYDYKIRNLKKIPAEYRCYFLEETVPNSRKKPILFDRNLNKETVSFSELMEGTRKFENNPNVDNCYDLIDWYCSGYLKDWHAAKITCEENTKYLLVQPFFNTIKKDGTIIKRIDDIIEIPKALYLLQLLEQEKFDLLADEDISEQLSLFELAHVRSFDIDEFKRMDEYKITNDVYDTIVAKSENDQTILKVLMK